MRDLTDDENEHDYGPNELAHLSINNKEKHDRIVQSNLAPGDTIEKREQRNMEYAQKHLQRRSG